jgi:hypothetical protein
MKKWLLLSLLLLVTTLVLVAGSWVLFEHFDPVGLRNQSRQYNLRVGYLIDERLPILDDDVLIASLKEAERGLEHELGITFVRLIVSQTLPDGRAVEVVPFERVSIKEAFTEIEPTHVPPPAEDAFAAVPLEEARSFLPEDRRAAVHTRADLLREMTDAVQRRSTQWQTWKTPGGAPLVDDRSRRWLSDAGWQEYLRTRTPYDIVITNVPVLEDMVTPSNIHSVLSDGKVSGLGMPWSKSAPAHIGAAMVSTAEYTLPGMFRDKHRGNVPIERALGVYLLAHELAHMLGGLRDVLAREETCLMESSPKPDIQAFMRRFDARQGVCEKCARALRDSASLVRRL